MIKRYVQTKERGAEIGFRLRFVRRVLRIARASHGASEADRLVIFDISQCSI